MGGLSCGGGGSAFFKDSYGLLIKIPLMNSEWLSEPLSIIFLKSWRMGKCQMIGGRLTLSISSKRIKRKKL